MPEYNSNLRALNDIMADYGLSAGRRFEIDAWNAFAVHFGGGGGHQFNIDAMNEVVGLIGGVGTFEFEIDAVNEISRVFGGGSTFRFVEDALSEISDLPVFVLEGGGGEPEWVPDNAVIHIDLVGGTPQGRAWVEGVGEVAVDTLLGTDPNTANGWGDTEYDAENLGANGYGTDTPVALIGAARTKFFVGATVAIKLRGNSGFGVHFVATSADGNAATKFSADVGVRAIISESWGGDLDASISNIFNYIEASAVTNTLASTFLPTRLDLAANGSDAVSAVLTEDDYPTSGASQLVAVLINVAAEHAIQSITLYDALPSTAGLSALSETGVTNTAPTNLQVLWEPSYTTGVGAGTEFTFSAADGVNGSSLGMITFDDAEGNPCVLTVTDGGSNAFEISGVNLMPAGASPLAEGVYHPTVRATDPGGLYVEQEFTITVTA